MTFPVYLNFFGVTVHPHIVFELLAYTVGFQLYLLLRRRQREAALPVEQNLWLIVGCVFGAFVGSKLLALLESPVEYWTNRANPAAWMGGKTIVGGLLGGWVGVEIAKRKLGIARRTGDLFVFPLVIGMAIGRVGCFLTGLADHTHGVATRLPWAFDFGDGVPRHPTQLYEILFLLILGSLLLIRARQPYRSGDLWRWFIVGYLGFRFAIEFIKPRFTVPLVGLSAIQIASLAGVLAAAWTLRPRVRRSEDQLTEAVTGAAAAIKS